MALLCATWRMLLLAVHHGAGQEETWTSALTRVMMLAQADEGEAASI